MSIWRIYCNTENTHVFGESDSQISTCPNNPSHSVDSNSVVLIEETISKRKGNIVVIDTTGRGNCFTVKHNYYQTFATYIYNPNDNLSKCKMVVSTDVGGHIKIIDILNNQIISETQVSNTSKQIITSELSNLPELESIFEIQLKSNSNGKETRIYCASFDGESYE